MDTKNKVSMKADNNSGADNCYIVTITPPYGNMVTVTAWTNEQGNGLWIDGKQIKGTSQFYTNGRNVAAAMRRYFEKYPA